MLNLANRDHRTIYVDTLHMLARDAHYAGNIAARDFIRAYLVGLVPDVEREGFDAQLSVDSIPADIGQRCVDAVAKALEPIPEPAKPEPEPAGSRMLLQQSTSLQW